MAAFRFKDKNLRNGESVNYFLIIGVDSGPGKNSKQKIMTTFSKVNSPAKIQRIFDQTKKYWLNYLSRIEFDFKDNAFNNWLLWVK